MIPRAWRDQLKALVLGTAGSTRTVAAGYFVLCDPSETLETRSLDALERAVEFQISPGAALGTPTNDGLTDTSLRRYELRVRVGYLWTGQGADFDASGQQSGAGDREALEDRAETDRALLTAVLTWGPNTGSLTPGVIHVRESPVGPSLDVQPSGRGVMTIRFELLSRLTVAAPGPYGPTLVGS